MWYCSSIKVARAQFTPHCIDTLTPIRISFLELAAAAQSPDHNLPNFQPGAQGALHSAHSLRQRSNRCPVDHEARHRRQDRRMNKSSGCAKTKLILRCSSPGSIFYWYRKMRYTSSHLETLQSLEILQSIPATYSLRCYICLRHVIAPTGALYTISDQGQFLRFSKESL